MNDSRDDHALAVIALPWVESGHAPDCVIRWAIRRLNRKRLARESFRSGGQAQRALDEFVRAAESAPIACVPERANEQHYELPARFFEIVLGRHLKYSGCHWPESVDCLDDAEEAMLELTAGRAGLANGMRVLELGCGWGSLALYAAGLYPEIEWTAVSNSSSQREFIEARCRERDLRNVRILTADMNEFSIDETFDRVVSVEMFEHMRNHRALLERIRRWLSSDGRLFIHVFCHLRHAYLFAEDGATNWMGRYFFSGGMMPSYDLLTRYADLFRVEQQEFINGTHYARTAEAWLSHLDEHRGEVLSIFESVYGDHARTWLVRWRLFFMACSELFGHDQGKEWGVGHYVLRPA